LALIFASVRLELADMLNAFGLARRAGGVEDEQPVLSIHLLAIFQSYVDFALYLDLYEAQPEIFT
jgi:hypothetical protein